MELCPPERAQVKRGRVFRGDSDHFGNEGIEFNEFFTGPFLLPKGCRRKTPKGDLRGGRARRSSLFKLTPQGSVTPSAYTISCHQILYFFTLCFASHPNSFILSTCPDPRVLFGFGFIPQIFLDAEKISKTDRCSTFHNTENL